MGNRALQVYLTVRNPRNFLILLCVYIVTSLVSHYAFGYDGDFGLTNLVLSVEASTAGAVLMMVAEESARATAETLKLVLEIVREVRQIAGALDKNLQGTLLIAEAQRDMLLDHRSLLQALKDGDERILKTLTEGDEHESR
jgi:uncharacterized membrane protein